ncbi:MAG: tRNA (adenosine(37)-N6)-threonylcarbamoyltransferase complex dimerization subunit type 1 TsaB [Phycisphaerales bacterium]|nr:MAG: tRNA (adenosine(37)-N6)-threonylcarbamoyltransferase complex dimerization subunit type 1 TsaB [Phycisphaerales bacterium]
MSRPIVLAIETSQHRGSVALRDRRGDVHAEPLGAELRHDDDLLPAIDRLFKRLDLKPEDLGGGGAVGVSVGPGGFTGLRIGVSTAKALSEALGARLVAAPTALVAGESVEREQAGDGPVLVALASKGETFWATLLERDEQTSWSVSEPPGLADAADVTIENLTAVVGDEHVPRRLRDRCESVGTLLIEPRFEATACLAVTCRLLEAGRTIDPLELAPLYPREPEAVSLWEKRRSGR